MAMTCTDFEVLSRNQDETITIRATIYADEVPSTFPTTGENIDRLDSENYLLGPGSTIIVPNATGGLRTFVADSTGFYPATVAGAPVGSGAPTKVTLASQMTDPSVNYLYLGSEAGYTAGHWYYNIGGNWLDGGVFGGTNIDATLTQPGQAADAKATGDALALKWAKSDTDNVPTENSTNLIRSGAVFASEAVIKAAVSANTADILVISVKNTLTGASVELVGSLNKPVIALSAAIAAVQAGSGDPSAENIRAISGWAGVNVSSGAVNGTADDTVSVDWTDEAGTVYGGSINLVSGVLTVTHGVIAEYNGETLPGAWISDRDVYAEEATPTTGAQVVYELAEPVTYSLTAEDLSELIGKYMWADTGNVTVTYYEDTKTYIDNAIAAALGS